MLEIGEVIRTHKSLATVRFNRKEACGRCNMCMFRRDAPHVDVAVENTLNAGVGDLVEVSMSGGTVVGAALLVYLLPLAFAAVGLAVGLLLKNELLQLALCLGFLIVGYIIVIVADRILRLTKKVVPVMTKLVTEESKDGR